MQKSDEKIILWGVKASPYVQKVMVALAEKGLSYEQRYLLPSLLLQARHEPIPSEFVAASPLGKIPAIQVGDVCIADSAVIAAYLDKKFSTGTALYPFNPEEYATARWFEQYADTTLSDVTYKKIFVERIIKPALLNQPTNNAMVEQALSANLPPLLAYLTSIVSRSPWIGGQHFSMADVAIAVQLSALQKAGFSFDEQWSVLLTYLQKVTDRPSFRTVLPE